VAAVPARRSPFWCVHPVLSRNVTVQGVHLDSRGRLWIGTNNGLTTWQDGRFGKPMTVADGLFANNVFAMASTAGDDLWIGSFGGVTHLRPGK